MTRSTCILLAATTLALTLAGCVAPSEQEAGFHEAHGALDAAKPQSVTEDWTRGAAVFEPESFEPLTQPDVEQLTAFRDVFALTHPGCGKEGVPKLLSVEGEWMDERSRVAVTLRGLICESYIHTFDFQILDEDGQDIQVRPQHEVNEVAMEEDGTFTLRGVASSSCGTIGHGSQIQVAILPSNAVVADIEDPQL